MERTALDSLILVDVINAVTNTPNQPPQAATLISVFLFYF